jgi:hypothetical protein
MMTSVEATEQSSFVRAIASARCTSDSRNPKLLSPRAVSNAGALSAWRFRWRAAQLGPSAYLLTTEHVLGVQLVVRGTEQHSEVVEVVTRRAFCSRGDRAKSVGVCSHTAPTLQFA